MKKIPCTSQNMEAQNLPDDVYIFSHFGRLSPAAVPSANCWFGFRVKWWIHISSIVRYLYKNFFLSCWNSCKQHSELSIHCFWLTVSKCNNHFEPSFLINKCKMVNILPSDIFNSSAISLYFQFIFSQNEFGDFLLFSGTSAEFWWHELSTSFMSVRLCIKSAYHLFTIVYKEQSLNKTYQAIPFIEQYFFPSESNALSTTKIQISPLFWKFVTVASLK